jgi:tetratricopeptide (TPR) repeat protein
VGRAAELRALETQLGERRLVTVVGPAGVGKTRLALRSAGSSRAPGGVFFCRLAEATDIDGLIAIVARTLGLPEEVVAGNDRHAVAHALCARGRCLLVLDNLEPFLPDVAALVASWLEAAPGMSCLATSREPLGVADEGRIDLRPLAAGPGGDEATELLVARLRSLRGEYNPDDQERLALAGIARELTGLPLALEMAASLLNVGDPGEVLSVLAPPRPPGRGADAPPRPPGRGADATPPPARPPLAAIMAKPPARKRNGERTPSQALDCAWHLLPQRESNALAQCSVFRGGFSVEAAREVVHLSWSTPIAEVLQAAHRRFLLRRDGDARARFSMCESLAAHAADMLELWGESTATRWRHARYYLDLVEPLVVGPTRPSPRVLAELAAERDNLQAVLDFGAQVSRPDLVLRAAVALDALAPGTGLLPSQLARVDAALARARRALDQTLVGRALGARASALRCLGRLQEAERDAVAALSLAEAAGDARLVAAMHAVIGDALFQLGRLDDAQTRYLRVLELARAGSDPIVEVAALQSLGAIHQSAGRSPAALASYQASRDLAGSLGDAPGEARAAMCLGSYWLERGELQVARVHYERGQWLARHHDLQRHACIVGGYLGVLHFDAGELEDAERALDEAVGAARALGDLRVEGIFSGILGAVLAAQDQLATAERSFLLAERLLRANPFFAETISVHRGHLDLAEARAARRRGDGAAAAAATARARARLDAARERLAARSDDARIAIRILETRWRGADPC